MGFELLTSVYFVLPPMPLFLVSLYSICAYGPKWAPAIGLAVGTATVSMGGFVLSGQVFGDPWFHLLVRLLPFVLCAWSLGMFRRVRLAYLAALRQRAERAEAEREQRARSAVADERARIAREMHDVVAHALSVMVSQANGGRYLAGADPQRAVAVLETISETGSQALADTRGILRVLRVDGETGAACPQPDLDELPALMELVRQAGLPVSFEEIGQRRSLGPAAELAVFRLVQEALTDTMKHAGDQARARVRFDWAVTAVRITIHDNGIGSGDPEPGHGLVGMRERLSIVGGTVSTGGAEGDGFLVTATLPYEMGVRA